MSIASRRKKMAKALEKSKKEFLELDERTSKETVRFLKGLRRDIRTAIVGAEGWEVGFLTSIRDEIGRAIRRFEGRFSALVSGSQDLAWGLGIDGVDKVLTAAEITAIAPILSDAQLIILRDFSADLVSGLTADTLAKINNAVSLGVVGARSPYETMKDIDRTLGIEKVKGVTARAEKIARTEVGRAQSVARQARMEQMAERVPDLKKQWITGINPRETHARMDGQVRWVNDPYILNGYRPMEPRDPSLPAKEVVNCNCTSEVYLMELA